MVFNCPNPFWEIDNLNKVWFGMVCNMNFSKHYGFFVAKGMKDMQGGIYFSANDMKKSVKISDLRRKDWDYVCFKFKLSRYIKKDKV